MISFSLGAYNLSSAVSILPLVSVALVAAYVIFYGARTKHLKGAITIAVAIVVLMVFVELFALAPLYSGNTSSGVNINIGKGFVEFDASETGMVNVSASQITNVSIVHMDTGLLVMSKDHGLGGRVSQTLNYLNLGVYTLSNGKTAYVASNNLTDLVVGTTDNYYLVLAPQNNLTAFLTDFSTYVYPVPGY